MENFGELLNQYVKRSGISDSELARAVGVSRQTIFRWREGQTTRPRHREDVLALAKKLRLADDEKDKLLLAGGFRPVKQEPEAGEKPEDKQHLIQETSQSLHEPVPTKIVDSRLRGNDGQWGKYSLRGRVIILLTSIIFAGLIFWGVQSFSELPLGEKNSLAIPFFNPKPIENSSQTDETLILVTHFANYGSSQVGYNVAGRIAEALIDEIEQSNLQNIRVEVWPSEIDSEADGLAAGKEAAATLVIYGEYDVGRVVVHFTQPDNVVSFNEPAIQHSLESIQALSARVNSDIPEEVRSLALLALGQIFLVQEDANQAQALLLQAKRGFERNGKQDSQTWAVLNFYLGLAYHSSQPPDLDRAIVAYSTAVSAQPNLIAPYTNRIAAYQSRKQTGDLEQALADARVVISARPASASAHNNLGAILASIGNAENLQQAIESFNKAITLAPNDPIAYFNRAQVQFNQGSTMESISPDLEKAIGLNPEYGSALNLYCWGYNLEGSPAKALPTCEKAVEVSGGNPLYRDSRALAYAQLGNFPAAIADLKAYIAWLEVQPANDTRKRALSIRQGWIPVLKQGVNPITPEILAEIRD